MGTQNIPETGRPESCLTSSAAVSLSASSETRSSTKRRVERNSHTAAPKPGVKLNVKDLGAKGDGTTKDTLALQQALDRCSVLGGGEVIVPSGEYLTERWFCVRTQHCISRKAPTRWAPRYRRLSHDTSTLGGPLDQRLRRICVRAECGKYHDYRRREDYRPPRYQRACGACR